MSTFRQRVADTRSRSGRTRLRILVAVALVTAATGMGATEAPAAVPSDICTGQGVAISGPLPAPVTVTQQDYPIQTRSVTVRQPRWVNVAFSLALGTCALDLGKNFTAFATLTGWCGHNSGYGVTSHGHRFTWIEAGGVALIMGQLTGIAHVTADPLVGGNDCFTNAVGFPPRAQEVGATRFIVTFAVAKSSCAFLHEWRTQGVPIPPFLTDPIRLGTYDVSIHGGPVYYHVTACI